MTKRIDVDETVRELDEGKTPDWIAEHLRLYRESGGAEGHLFDGGTVGEPGMLPCLLLTTTGRRSGKKRTSPLVYGTSGDAYIVIGSKGGAETHPWWYLNLSANPVVEVQVAKEVFTARARIATGGERDKLWKQMASAFPFYGKYQRKTRREIPVVVLEKQPPR
jgi:deazaflavin-dependent oxidoreductase (nitroreductase family)